MYNRTAHPIVLLSRQKLVGALRVSIEDLIRKEARDQLRRAGHRPIFTDIFSQIQKRNILDEQLVCDLLEFAQVRDLKRTLQSCPNDVLNRLLDHMDGLPHAGGRLQVLQRWIRTLLIRLWSERALILPLRFLMFASLKDHPAASYLTPVAKSFATSAQDALVRYGVRIALATDWHEFKDIGLGDIAEMHARTLESHAEPIPGIRLARWPWESIVDHLSRYRKRGFRPTDKDIEVYKQWIGRSLFLVSDFSRFSRNPQALADAAKQRLESTRLRCQLSSKLRQTRLRIAKMGLGDELPVDYDPALPIQHLILQRIAEHNDPEKYFVALKTRKRRGRVVAAYPGREHVDVQSMATVWRETFEAFLAARRDSGRETDEGPVGVYTLLEDYLFLYLPWWKEMNPGSDFEIPLTPDRFRRFGHLLPDVFVNTSRPKSFLELLPLRRKPDTQQQVIHTLSHYFEYLEANRDRFSSLRGREFRTPIAKTLDTPKRKRPSKSTKRVLPRRIMPFLLRYAYWAEQVGINLQSASIAGRLDWNPYSHASPAKEQVIPASFGVNAEFSLEGQAWRIGALPPEIFRCGRRPRRLRLPSGGHSEVWLPHLGALRFCIVLLETGLRGQSVQWLDVRTFDSRNGSADAASAIFELVVNTDKVKARPWVTFIPDRVRALLKREESFQLSIAEPAATRKIWYENRVNSRFGEVRPLFRSSGPSGSPLADNEYHESWAELLLGFQTWYNSHVAHHDNKLELVEFSPGTYETGTRQTSSKFAEVDGTHVEHTPFRLSALYTPHSARTSFASHRASILPLGDIAAMLGHNSAVTTIYYVQVDPDELRARAESARNSLWDVDSENPAHVRADAVNSELRKAFHHDVGGAIRRFGCDSAWNKDPVFGVIGTQTGPRG